ncbi:glycosyltransferase family 1 protein [Erwinia endophytica]|uniref:glycosyltransferase n=1 Tax=Erwinia endophytica TaxID=1563158 RepID=UPI001265DF17|nr:glycosyltransferase [Erwinia endophytica]KAB8307383.1 glycosyltransferase family 1 protein [Erwinia endophytica]
MHFLFGSKKANTQEVDLNTDTLSVLSNLRPDIPKHIIKTLIMDGDCYLSTYQDVKDAGICPIEHYFSYGESEGRTFFPPMLHNRAPILSSIPSKKVYFSQLPANNGSFLYRIDFPSRTEKDVVIVNYESTLIDILTSFFSAKSCVFVRPSNNEKTIFLIQLSRVLGVRVIYDFDDLMLPEYTDEKGAIRSDVADYKLMFNHLMIDSALLTLSDEITCTTKLILDKYKHLNSYITVQKNKLPKSFFRDKNYIIQSKTKKHPQKIKILYLSGTITHLKDYSLISGPLLKLCQDFHDKIEFNFMGELKDQSKILEILNIDSHFISYESFESMLETIGKHDLVLVPLEKTIFNDAKSNIKFIEAASQGTAVIASPAEEFSSSIEHGINGWICQYEHDWYSTIKSIIEKPELSLTAGLKAYDKAFELYSYE